MGVPLSDVDLLGRLVGFDSTSCNSNLPIAAFLAEYAEAAGARIQRQPSADGGKCNLILRFGPEGIGGAGLCLSGHMDTVPAGEPEWESDPFCLRDDGERLYGRGACDMKGFVALALNLAAEARDLRRPLVLLLTYDEEVGTFGARQFAADLDLAESVPRATIVGEPTSLGVVRMHKGFLHVRVTMHGQSAHSAYPRLGVNAIESTGRVIAALRGLRAELEREGGPQSEHFPEAPFVSLNLGTIRGGAAANVIPDRCNLILSVRLLPGVEERAIVERLRAKVAGAAAQDRFEFEVGGASPPMLLAPDAPIHRALCSLTGQESGTAVSYATDAGWLARAGLDCAIWGPGSIEQAHRPNEFLPKAELAAARETLGRVVDRFCRAAE